MEIREIIQFFIKFKYLAIFPVAVVEGPIITIISGVLVSLGHLSLLPALLVVFLGDVFSDFIFYLIGRGGRYAIKYLKFLHIGEERIRSLENQFQYRPWHTMIIAKVSYGLGTVFMLASGISRMSFPDFFKYILSLDFIRSSMLLGLGFYFGKTAIVMGPTAIRYYITMILIIIPLYFIYDNKFRKLE